MSLARFPEYRATAHGAGAVATAPADRRATRSSVSAMEAHRLRELEAEARHARERYDLYRAKMYGPRPTDPAEFRELERRWRAAAERLRHAKLDDSAGSSPEQ